MFEFVGVDPVPVPVLGEGKGSKGGPFPGLVPFRDEAKDWETTEARGGRVVVEEAEAEAVVGRACVCANGESEPEPLEVGGLL